MGDVKQGPHYYGELEEPFISPFMTGEIRIKHTFYIRYVKRAIDHSLIGRNSADAAG